MSDRGVVEGAAGLTQRALNVAKAHEHSGSFDLCDLLRALVADREALLEHIRQLEKQLLGGNKVARIGGES